MNFDSILLIVAILPVILICRYIYNKDRKKEPGHLLAKLFISGIGACFLVLIVSEVLSLFLPFMNIDEAGASFIEVLLYSFIGIALVEEGCKLFMTYLIGYKNKEFDELYDIIVYAVFVSLGFAAFENLLYVFSSDSLTIGILRGLLSIPGHACDGLFMGYYLSLAKISALRNDKQGEKNNLVKSLLIPTVLHGIFDFCLLSGMDILILVFFVFVINLYIISIRRLKMVASNNIKLFFKNKFCPVCGLKVQSDFCPRCGKEQV